jgi:hypothetical protein
LSFKTTGREVSAIYVISVSFIKVYTLQNTMFRSDISISKPRVLQNVDTNS